MKLAEQEQLLNMIENKVGMVKVHFKDIEGAEELISVYEEYKENGTSSYEAKLFLEDLEEFLSTVD